MSTETAILLIETEATLRALMIELLEAAQHAQHNGAADEAARLDECAMAIVRVGSEIEALNQCGAGV